MPQINKSINKIEDTLLTSLKRVVREEFIPCSLEKIKEHYNTYLDNITELDKVSSMIKNITTLEKIILAQDLSTNVLSSIGYTPTIKKIENKIPVSYTEDCKSFCEVFNNFISQAKEQGVNVKQKDFSKKVGMSSSAFCEFQRNVNSYENISIRKAKGFVRTRNKILAQYDIYPPGSLDKILELPIFSNEYVKLK